MIATSARSVGSDRSALSSVSVTSDMPDALRPEAPAKMTSSIRLPRSDLGLMSPSTHFTASTTLLLPHPLGPTMAVIPSSNSKVVRSQNDLKP